MRVWFLRLFLLNAWRKDEYEICKEILQAVQLPVLP